MHWKLWGKTITLRRLSGALGDNLMLSFLAREIKKAYPGKRVILETQWPALFENNPHVDKVVKGKKAKLFYLKPKYRLPIASNKNILIQLGEAIGLNCDNASLSVELFLSDEEIEIMRKQLPERFVALSPSSKQTFAANRRTWDFENFQQVVNGMPETTFVQIGTPDDPLLERVLDFRTIGYPIRASAAILHLASAGLFHDGGLMHLANSVSRKSVIVFGGAIHPDAGGYPDNINLFTPIECGPCFTSDRPMPPCEPMTCMKAITPEHVIRSLQKLLPLPLGAF